MNIDDLYKGKCLITFRYSDGSEVQCISTLNQELLSNLGLDYIDGFIDLLSYKIIPFELFSDVDEVLVEYNKKKNLTHLDSYFQDAIKRGWKNVR